MGYFSLLPLGSDFVSATLGSPGTGAGTGPVPERGVPKILSKLGLPVTIFHGLCLQHRVASCFLTQYWGPGPPG